MSAMPTPTLKQINAPIGCLKARGFHLGTSSEFSRRPSTIYQEVNRPKEGADVMHRNGQLWRAVSYTTVSAIIAFCMAYWPASAGNILTRLNVTPPPTSVTDVANQIHKADRLSSISFEERWNAVQTPSAGTRNERSQHKTPGAETHIEKIPFSCELAFSRLVTKGNFSTRCTASLEISKTDT
jgi:hypothetical protein